MTIQERPPGDFIGRGLTFPLRVDGQGRLALTSGGDDMDESLRLVIGTAPGERAMRPRFGCAIWELLYAPINATTLGEMAYAVRQALSEWEPRVLVEDVRTYPAPGIDGTVLIEVDYRIRATNDRRNLVHPFYVIPEEGEG